MFFMSVTAVLSDTGQARRKIGVRILTLWWSWGESNSRPKTSSQVFLRVQVMFEIPVAHLHNQSKNNGSSQIHDKSRKQTLIHVHHLNDALFHAVVIMGRTTPQFRQRKLILYR